MGVEAGSRVQPQPSCSSPPGPLLNLEKQWVFVLLLAGTPRPSKMHEGVGMGQPVMFVLDPAC